jgi:4-amino-4-deoxy-L-arabinose transferase-like glycosyltransferase
MIQRIQSIWLLLAAVCAFLTLKFSTYVGTNKDLIPSSFLNGIATLPLIFVTLATGILALVTIFLYKNRKQQWWFTLLAGALEVGLIFLYYREIQTYVGKGTFSITAILHAAVILFLILAARGINSDDKLIKDSNRLR